MTKKDFIAVANALHHYFVTSQVSQADQDVVLSAIVPTLAHTNPLFNADRFRAVAQHVS